MAVNIDSTSLRERKKHQMRQALEAAALELFAERGFDQVSVEEIASAVGVSSRTFFRYFGSKEDVVLGPMLAVQPVLAAALAQRPAEEPVLETLRRALDHLAHHLEAQRPDLVLRFQIAKRTPALAARAIHVREEWRMLLARTVAARLGVDLMTDPRPHVAAAWAMAGLSAARARWDFGATDRDLPSLLDEAFELLSGDLAAALAPASRPSLAAQARLRLAETPSRP
jgi:AcrR family transcriptional regulator